jgi:hypothetical protein
VDFFANAWVAQTQNLASNEVRTSKVCWAAKKIQNPNVDVFETCE